MLMWDFYHNCHDKINVFSAVAPEKNPSLNASSSLGAGNKLPPLLFVTQVGYSLLGLARLFCQSLGFASLFPLFYPPLLNLTFHNPMIFCFHKNFLCYSPYLFI